MEFDKVKFRLKCDLCDEIAKCPKFLPDCSHTFCEDCLRGYIIRNVPVTGHAISDYTVEKVPDFKSTKQSYVCPYDDCKSENKPYDPNKKVSQWVYQCYNDLERQTIIEMCQKQFGTCTWLCQKCSGMSLDVKATHVCFNHVHLYCSTCVFIHNKLFKKNQYCSKQTFHISDIEGILSKGAQSESCDDDHKSSTLQIKESPKVYCKLHQTYEIKYYCSSCDVDCCFKCCDKMHAQCMWSIKDNNIDVIEVTKTLKERLSRTLSDMNKLHEDDNEQLGTIKEILPPEKDASAEIDSDESSASATDSPRSDGENKIENEIKDSPNATASTQCGENCKCEICLINKDMEHLQLRLQCQVDRWDFLKDHTEKLLFTLDRMEIHTIGEAQQLDNDVRLIEQEVFHKTRNVERDKKKVKRSVLKYKKAGLDANTSPLVLCPPVSLKDYLVPDID